jgi:hypothetical protein
MLVLFKGFAACKKIAVMARYTLRQIIFVAGALFANPGDEICIVIKTE